MLVVSEIVWWSPDPMRVSAREYGLQLGGTVGKMVDGRGWSGVKVGLDPKQKVVCLARDDDGLKLGKSGQTGKRVASKKVVRWLKERGVQEGRYLARWENVDDEEVLIIDVEMEGRGEK